MTRSPTRRKQHRAFANDGRARFGCEAGRRILKHGRGSWKRWERVTWGLPESQKLEQKRRDRGRVIGDGPLRRGIAPSARPPVTPPLLCEGQPAPWSPLAPTPVPFVAFA